MSDLSFLHQHSVHFYGNDEALIRTVGGFVAEGLGSEQPAIIIASEAHRAGVLEDLGRRLIDVERAQSLGFLVLHDAEDLLALFMRDGAADSILFEQSIGEIVGDVVRRSSGKVVRAFGSMVDILWQSGNQDAAMKVEFFWNRLAQKHHFALLCGYSMGHFYKLTAQLLAVSDLHTHVVEAAADEVGPAGYPVS